MTSAEAVALKWLSLTDAGGYARSWDAAAALIQASISEPNWAAAFTTPRLEKDGSWKVSGHFIR